MTPEQTVHKAYPESYAVRWYDYYVIIADPQIDTIIGTGNTIPESWESAANNIIKLEKEKSI